MLGAMSLASNANCSHECNAWSNANCSAECNAWWDAGYTAVCNAWSCAVAVAVVAAVVAVAVVAVAVAVAVLTAMLGIIIAIAILIWLEKFYSSRVAGGGAVCLRFRRPRISPLWLFRKYPIAKAIWGTT